MESPLKGTDIDNRLEQYVQPFQHIVVKTKGGLVDHGVLTAQIPPE